MYLDEQGAAPATAGSGWRVEPEQLREFRAAVEQVRADLNRIASDVNAMSTPMYAPMLGTSPVGRDMADKFADRMGSEDGLRGQLQEALLRMEQFIRSAEMTVKTYEEMDAERANTSLRLS